MAQLYKAFTITFGSCGKIKQIRFNVDNIEAPKSWTKANMKGKVQIQDARLRSTLCAAASISTPCHFEGIKLCQNH
jgi:hypothetical protein